MRLNRTEIESTGINLKAWLGEMQRVARGPEGPIFALKGPCVLKVRKRRLATGGPATATASHSFLGGEEFRIGGIVADADDHNDTVQISVTLTPAKMALSSEMSGMTLPLQQCLELFEGFEAWSDSFTLQKYREPAKKPATVAEQRQSNEMWGAW